jgi:hypothetical protein
MIYNIIPNPEGWPPSCGGAIAKRRLYGTPSLALANHLAPTIKIKGKSWICVDIVIGALCDR